MNELKVTTKLSPRLEDGILKWYYKNTFSYKIKLSIKNTKTGELLQLFPEDHILIEFYKEGSSCVLKRFDVTGPEVVEGIITLNFDDAITRIFEPGRYQYCVTLHKADGLTRSLLINCLAEVERCH